MNTYRIYDYLLGGKDNYAADRAAAHELLFYIPDARQACHQNRGFVQRAVRFLAAEARIGQFIDIGTGLPIQGNVHEVARQARPDSRNSLWIQASTVQRSCSSTSRYVEKHAATINKAL